MAKLLSSVWAAAYSGMCSNTYSESMYANFCAATSKDKAIEANKAMPNRA